MVSVLNLLVTLLLVGILIYAINWFVGILALPPQIKQIVLVIVGIIGLLWLIGILFPGLGLGVQPLLR